MVGVVGKNNWFYFALFLEVINIFALQHEIHFVVITAKNKLNGIYIKYGFREPTIKKLIFW